MPNQITRSAAAALLAHFAAEVGRPTEDVIGYGPGLELRHDFVYCGRCEVLEHVKGIEKARAAAGKHQRTHRGTSLISCCPD